MEFLSELPALIDKVGLGGTVLLLLIVAPYSFVFLLLKQLTQKQAFIEAQQTDFTALNTKILQSILMQSQDNTKVLQELSIYLSDNNAQIHDQQSNINLLAHTITDLNGKLSMVIQFAIDETKGEK